MRLISRIAWPRTQQRRVAGNTSTLVSLYPPVAPTLTIRHTSLASCVLLSCLRSNCCTPYRAYQTPPGASLAALREGLLPHSTIDPYIHLLRPRYITAIMVTRKPIKPRVSTSQAQDANPLPYPATPIDSNKIPASTNSIYSPNLGTSPAFDLIDMNEAQKRPRRDSDVSSNGTWDSPDEEDRETPEESELPQPLRIAQGKQKVQQSEVAAKPQTSSLLLCDLVRREMRQLRQRSRTEIPIIQPRRNQTHGHKSMNHIVSKSSRITVSNRTIHT